MAKAISTIGLKVWEDLPAGDVGLLPVGQRVVSCWSIPCRQNPNDVHGMTEDGLQTDGTRKSPRVLEFQSNQTLGDYLMTDTPIKSHTTTMAESLIAIIKLALITFSAVTAIGVIYVAGAAAWKLVTWAGHLIGVL